MMGHVLAITLKELKILWKDRTALALLFAMPLFFIIVMSFALEGVFESGQKNRPVTLLVVNQDSGPGSEKAMEELFKLEGLVFQPTLQGIPLTLDRAEDLIKRKAYAMALVFNRDFSKKIQGDEKPDEAVYLIMDPAINQQLAAPIKGAIRGTLERIIQTARISQVLSIPGEDKNLELTSLGKDAAPFVLKTIPPREFKSNRFPTAVEQSVPAYTIFGVFFIIVTLASSFLKEKSDGTFLRILAAPLSSTSLLIGKLIPYYLVNLVQIALMFFVGVVLFGVKLGSLPGLILVSLALALAANGLGLLIASLGKTEGQINGLSVLLVVTLAALGGMMVPTFIMPPVMRTLSLFTPHAWALAGYHDVMIRGLSFRAVLPETGMLLGFAASFFLLALWRFRF
jgi:ABC-type multidrug transport system permease subunit